MFSVFTLKYMMSLRGTSFQFSRKLKGTPGEVEDVLEMSFLIVEQQPGFNRTRIRARVQNVREVPKNSIIKINNILIHYFKIKITREQYKMNKISF